MGKERQDELSLNLDTDFTTKNLLRALNLI